jgi:uncharacterized protein (TIGR03790 family)
MKKLNNFINKIGEFQMKRFIIISLFFLLFLNFSEAQTNANIAGPENVLIIYNKLDQTSTDIKDYYQNARNIPESNILGISIPDSVQMGNGLVTLRNSGEILHSYNNRAAWDYYKLYIADSIENYLSNTYINGMQLKNSIRYIVLCKGIPLKLWTYEDYETSYSYYYHRNVSLDALVCLLYQDVISLYNTVVGQSNPYKLAADIANYTFDYRFITNHFTNSNGWKLNYLVTRLDGDSYEDIEGMIDRSVSADVSGLNYWVLDADVCHNIQVTQPVHYGGYMSNALNELKANFFNTNPEIYNADCDFIVDNPAGSVIGYTSCGYHSWLGLVCQDPEYNPNYMSCLNFNYAPGAIFNTFESYNGAGMYQANREGYFGMVSDFIQAGGTGGLGHTWEPRLSGAALNINLFNLYAMGYSFADAAYQSIPWIAWNNVVVGDPLNDNCLGKANFG